MAQTRPLVVCGDAGEALGDSIYEARLYVRGEVAEPRAPTASRRRCATSTAPSSRELLERRGHRRRRARRVPPLRLGARSSTTSRSTTRARTDDRVRRTARGCGRPLATRLRESSLFDRNVIDEIQRTAREGIYDIRGFGAKRRVPHFDDLLFLGASISRYPLEGYRERCATDVTLGTRFAKKPLQLEDPDHDRRDELRRALGAGQGGARPRRERGRHVARPPATAA